MSAPAYYVDMYSAKIPPSERRAIVERLRADPANAGRNRKQIAEEYGCSVRTVSRAVEWELKTSGAYDPDAWKQLKAEERKARGERWLTIFQTRDEIAKETSQEYAELARQAKERIERADALEATHERERRRALQAELNARNRRLVGA